MDQLRETFRKSERLCSRKMITELFEKGNIFRSSLFKIVWLQADADLPCRAQVAFTVSKKGFRHAVTRNLIKRRLREAYRKNKNKLYEFLQAENINIAFIIIYRADDIQEFSAIEKSIKDMIDKMIKTLKEKKQKC